MTCAICGGEIDNPHWVIGDMSFDSKCVNTALAHVLKWVSIAAPRPIYRVVVTDDHAHVEVVKP